MCRCAPNFHLPAPTARSLLDLYLPPGVAAASPLPVVVLVAGYPDPGFSRMLGCRFKDMGSSVSWARLIAASGMAAVTYTNRDPEADVHALVAHLRKSEDALGLDAGRVGVWASSGNAPLALSLLAAPAWRPRCAALLYGYLMDLDGATGVADVAATFHFANACAGRSLDDLAGDVPLFLARAGLDEMPGLNAVTDRFVAAVLTRNWPLRLVNHPTGPHAFDLMDDSDQSRAVVKAALAFLAEHLVGS